MSLEPNELAQIRRDLVVALINTASTAELKSVASIAIRAKELETYIVSDMALRRGPGRPRKSTG